MESVDGSPQGDICGKTCLSDQSLSKYKKLHNDLTKPGGSARKV